VRELENMVERLVILSASDTVSVAHLPDQVRTPSARLAAVAAAPLARRAITSISPAPCRASKRRSSPRAMKAANGNKTTRSRGPWS